MIIQTDRTTNLQKFYDFVIRRIPIQPQQHSFISKAIALSPYAINYLLIIIIMIFNIYPYFKGIQQSLSVTVIIIMCNFLLSILFLIFKNSLIYTFIKISMIVDLLLVHHSYSWYQILQMLLKIKIVTTWVLTKDQRMVNLDSRLDLLPLWKKQILILIFTILYRISLDFDYHNQLIILVLLGLLYLDNEQRIYNLKLKKILIGLDIQLLITLIISIIIGNSNESVLKFIFPSIFSLVLIAFICLIWQHDYQIIYNFPGVASNEQYLDYFMKLQTLIRSKNQRQISKFMKYHQTQCKDIECPLQYIQDNIQQGQNQNITYSLLEMFIIKEIVKYHEGNPVILKYLIFKLSPTDKVYRYLGKKVFYQRRQMIRLENYKNSYLDCEVRANNIQLRFKEIKNTMIEYLETAKKYWLCLMEINLNAQQIIKEGQQLLFLIQKIQKYQKLNSEEISLESRQLLNNFSKYIMCSNEDLLPYQNDPPFMIKRNVESIPTVLIQAEGQHFTQFTNVNLQMCKMTYYSKQNLLKLKIDDMIPIEMKQAHRLNLQKASKRLGFVKPVNLNNGVFVKNRIGYSVIFKAVIYPLNSLSGRKWCVTLEPDFIGTPIIIVHDSGKIMGLNEMCLEIGINKSIQQYYINEKIMSQIRKNPAIPIIVKQNENIFQNYELVWDDRLSLNRRLTFSFFTTFYFVEIRKIPPGRDKTNSLRLMESTSRISKIIKQQQTKFLFPSASFQFYRTLDGNLQNYQTLHSMQESVQSDKESIIEKKNWAEDIIEMRLVGEKIDFVENIEIQEQFEQHIQCQNQQLTNFPIKEQFYKETVELRKNITPQWLLIVRIAFISYIISLIGLFSFNYYLIRLQLKQNNTISQANLATNRILLLLINLGTSSIEYNYDNTTNIQASIKQSIDSLTNQYSDLMELDNRITNMFDKATSVETYKFNHSRFNEMESKFRLEINQLTIQGFQNTSNVLDSLMYGIYPGWMWIIQQANLIYQQDTQMNHSNVIIVVVVIIILSIIIVIYLYKLLIYLSKQRQNILEILIHIENEFLEHKIYLNTQFKNHIFYGTQIQNEEYSQPANPIGQLHNQPSVNSNILSKPKFHNESKIIQKQSIKLTKTQQKSKQYSKKLINLPSDHWVLMVSLFWLVVLIISALSMLLLHNHIMALHNTERDFIMSLNQFITSYQMIWVGMNNLDNLDQSQMNIELVDAFQQNMYQQENNFQEILLENYPKGYFSDSFNDFFYQLFYKDCCKYLSQFVPTCKTDINGSLSEGVSQVFASLNINFDYMMHHPNSQQIFVKQLICKQAFDIQKKYIPIVMNQVQKKLLEENGKLRDNIKIMIIQLYCLGMGISLIGGLIYLIYSRYKSWLITLQQLINLIPFNKLMEINQFRIYIKSKITSEII